MRRTLVTGGSGFIGSALVRQLVAGGCTVLNVDALTYAGHDINRQLDAASYSFSRTDIASQDKLRRLIDDFRPDVIFHLAAETHVDRSIDDASLFISTNIVGTFNVLQGALNYWNGLNDDGKSAFRLIHVSTDEVYGTLDGEGLFRETSRYAPNSPYSASKASADHLARAWQRTYGLPVIITNCSNNYGPYQHPEKLIPTIIRNALARSSIPIYGTGANVRDWLYVDDHASGLLAAAAMGVPGETYLFGGRSESTNLALCQAICDMLDRERPMPDGTSHRDLITFVTDRPGHDYRYGVDCSKAERDLGWSCSTSFSEGLKRTLRWYLDNAQWFERPLDELQRLGLGPLTADVR